ncbi:polysialyltransferase family glycosyltransferase [Roseivirga misakiensis]|uniref:Uncharacterized protein n=1 Tax=Roseivirga misakiensis TaxID=1563681 RepID=A0A1E5T1E8_9BACT|nr:polysialyltransferase family glycosyltransferase [Roseivirga misakiensis]OEK05203.1 hypothetical protein BFP71_17520 [Roseivirga misakiensis]
MKKHFLVIWPTIRKDWISTFLELKDEFHFTFIPSLFPQTPNYAKGFDCHYWSEFTSVNDMLDQLKPDAVIYMSIESGLSIALNTLAKKRGIKTYVLQHGIFTNYKDYRIREKLWRKGGKAKEAKIESSAAGFSTGRFLKNSFKPKSLWRLFPILIYTRAQQKIGPYWASRYIPLKMKRADEYLCFSPNNATIHRETDRISENHITYIGSHELAKFLKPEEELILEDFYLHIDQALADNSFGEETVSKESMVQFYHKLNEYCLSKGARLFIKLHPETYSSNWLPNDPNIVYLKQVDNLNQYMQSARACFGFYSTMIVPAVYWKPTCLFKIFYSGLQEALLKEVNLPVLGFFDFTKEEISFSNDPDKEVRQSIKENFINPSGSVLLNSALS